MSGGVRACQSNIIHTCLTVSAVQDDVDIPSHVVEIERGSGKRGHWLHLHLPLATPLVPLMQSINVCFGIWIAMSTESTMPRYGVFKTCLIRTYRILIRSFKTQRENVHR